MTIRIVGLLTVILALASPGQVRPAFVNKSGEVGIVDFGKWQLVAGSDVVDKGQAVFKAHIPAETMFVQVKFFEIKPSFDVMTPEFRNQIKSSLSQGGMKVVSSGETTLLGQKAFAVYAVKLTPKKDEDLITYVVSWSAFFGDKFMTMSISDDDPDIAANSDTLHLLRNLKVLKK